MNPHYKLILKFRTQSSDLLNNHFDKKIRQFHDQIIQTETTDYEVVYQEFLDEFEQIRNQFHFQQCGDKISLTKIYFTTTYLTCPSCHTQNTFAPSSKMRGFEYVGCQLAEQRTQYLIELHQAENIRERDLYHQIHLLRLKLGIEEKDTPEILAWEEQRQTAIKKAPLYYQQVRASDV